MISCGFQGIFLCNRSTTWFSFVIAIELKLRSKRTFEKQNSKTQFHVLYDLDVHSVLTPICVLFCVKGEAESCSRSSDFPYSKHHISQVMKDDITSDENY